MSQLKHRQEQIIKDFSLFNSWEEKYEYLIDLGHNLPLIETRFKTKDSLIKGCQSNVWLDVKVKNNKLEFSADSDAIITKGLISMIISIYNNLQPKEILSEELFFIDQIGLKEHLSPTRSNGLIAMITKIKQLALKHLS